MEVPTHNAAVEIDDCNAGKNKNAGGIDDPKLSPSQAHGASARSHTPNKADALTDMEGARPRMEGALAGMESAPLDTGRESRPADSPTRCGELRLVDMSVDGPAVSQPVDPGTLA